MSCSLSGFVGHLNPPVTCYHGHTQELCACVQMFECASWVVVCKVTHLT